MFSTNNSSLMRLKRPLGRSFLPFRRRWIFVLLVVGLVANTLVGILAPRQTLLPKEMLPEEVWQAPERPSRSSQLTTSRLPPSSSSSSKREGEGAGKPVPPPPHKRKKPKMPYDIDQPVSKDVLQHVHFNSSVPVVLAQDNIRSETFRRKDGMDYFIDVRVPNHPQELDNEDEEDPTTSHEADSASSHSETSTTRLVYRIHSSLYQELPVEEPHWNFSTCAVVGNSGTMLHHEWGEQIDNHQAIIRLNNAPIRHFGEHVGTRTTFNFINQHHAKELAYSGVAMRHKGATVVVYESTYSSVRSSVFPRLLNVLPDQALLLSPKMVITTHTLWLQFKAMVEEQNRELRKSGNRAKSSYKRKPMSGFFAVLFALQMCDEITLYGFSNYNRHETNGARKGKVPYHYFDQVAGVTTVHSFDLSIEVFKLLQTVHNVTLF